ncbi:glutamate--cysteine ligase [Baaleninema sp.]|uniref:glutamate--cysteine ligase n=1 Tax=Baaleninema sp. TaxID=3101197 RepID=UPI003D059041
MLLPKGFEVEMYTGTPEGEIVGLSDRIVADLDRFSREPDKRNVEYTTAPLCSYDQLLCELVRPRQILRDYLHRLGSYTLVPGSTLSLGDSGQFFRSDPNNPYHDFIERSYGSTVVTASVHINVGIGDLEVLMRANRLIRVEAPLYLALSASSPFLDGKVTGDDSTRWQVFPQVPEEVPLFDSHGHFVRWTEEQLALGTMQNVRHLWSSVRPNGDRRPYNLNRLELRICDLIADPIDLLAVTALLEARIWQTILDPSLDPLASSRLPENTRAEALLELTRDNERAVAKDSLDATLRHWEDGREILARDWIEQMYQTVLPTAKERGIRCFLSPIRQILREGNPAQQWRRACENGSSPREQIVGAIEAEIRRERELEDKLCRLLVA